MANTLTPAAVSQNVARRKAKMEDFLALYDARHRQLPAKPRVFVNHVVEEFQRQNFAKLFSALCVLIFASFLTLTAQTRRL